MKTLICKIIILMIFIINTRPVNAGSLSAMAGVYDFTDEEEREFYKVAYMFLVSYDFFNKSVSSLELSTGSAYSSVKYNSNRHKLLVIPVYCSYIINFNTGKETIEPFIGAGLGLYYKRDYSPSANRTYTAYKYGYHYLVGFRLPVGTNTSFIIRMTNNIVISTRILDEINLNGISTLFGFSYNFL